LYCSYVEIMLLLLLLPLLLTVLLQGLQCQLAMCKRCWPWPRRSTQAAKRCQNGEQTTPNTGVNNGSQAKGAPQKRGECSLSLLSQQLV
jgi:hypothetical protein